MLCASFHGESAFQKGFSGSSNASPMAPHAHGRDPGVWQVDGYQPARNPPPPRDAECGPRAEGDTLPNWQTETEDPGLGSQRERDGYARQML